MLPVFQVHVGNDEYIHIRVHEALPHAGRGLSLHSYQQGKSKDDKIEYF